MVTVYKYRLEIADRQTMNIPPSYDGKVKIVHVGLDPHGIPSLWAEVDTTKKPTFTGFCVLGTGFSHPDADYTHHIGSFMQGTYMWHVYMLNLE